MVKILMVDEDPAALYISKRLFNSYLPQTELETVSDANIVLERLVVFESKPGEIPDIIMADLNICKRDNWSFLKRVNLFCTLMLKPYAIYILEAYAFDDDYIQVKKFSSVAALQRKPLTKDWLQQLETEGAFNY